MNRRCFSMKCGFFSLWNRTLFQIFLEEFPKPLEYSIGNGANSNEESEARLPKATIFRSSARFAATPAVSATAGSNDD